MGFQEGLVYLPGAGEEIVTLRVEKDLSDPLQGGVQSEEFLPIFAVEYLDRVGLARSTNSDQEDPVLLRRTEEENFEHELFSSEISVPEHLVPTLVVHQLREVFSFMETVAIRWPSVERATR